MFELDPIDKHLGQVVAEQGWTQLRVAETEKYPHVTYFFNGGVEAPFAGEERHVVPSPRDVKTYDLKPEMSALQVCEVVCKAIREGRHDVIVVNFANCDMVGHTGVLEAAIKAVETVDSCLGTILATYDEVHGAGKTKAVIIADHGNAEQMIDYRNGTPHTAHTLYPGGALCDVAPTLLKLVGLPQPKEMTGKALF
jgi:2,3-bisphosphoglycerate-independent phosphoglycerate mutase